ncbi:MAG: hypothetical protein FJW35_03925 [Acidobacteria bacterium]|nr:hypothetical protein [Acidobacteriota bacterium]
MKSAAAIAGVTLMLVSMRPGFSCECRGPIFSVRDDIARALTEADLVFTGLVESIRLWNPKSIPGISDTLVAEFKVFEVFKGSKRRKFLIGTGGGGATSKGPGDCGYPFCAGEKYLVYAGADQYGWSLGTSYCDRTALLEYAAADLRFLKGQPALPEDRLEEEAYSRFFDRQYSSKICGNIVTAGSEKPGRLQLFLWSQKGGR